jgi:valyl-tRNA synthetase
MKDLPKAYIAKDYEDQIYKTWEESGAFQPDEKSKKDPFVITMPPPNATGTLHLGHAVMLAVEDIMIRFHRMNGRPALWIPGTDHAGIATQTKVERILMEEEHKTRHDIGREALIEKIKEFVAGSQNTIRNQFRKMGSSCDWSREYYSLDDSLNRTVNFAFKKMYDDGLIYRGDRIVHWCTRCASTLSDEEVEHKTIVTNFYYFQYGPFVIGTARPETKYGDHVVIVHPDDERYKKYHGKKLKIEWIADEPIEATVIADEASDPEFGSGVMTITPAHSFEDFDLAKKHGIPVVQMINEEGRMTEANGTYAGMEVHEARKKFVEALQKKGLVVKIDENYEQSLSVCSRCDTPIQPLVSKQWFIDVQHKVESWDYKNLKLEKGVGHSLKDVMLHVVREGQIEIIPDRFNKTYFQWIENLRDWCISRQLWWGHQIPVWYKGAVESSKFQEESEIRVQEESPGKGWVQDSDTLDTWFSAGMFTFSPLGWIDDKPDFKKYHPTSMLETGYDIIFFWVARMILMTTYLTGQVPFEKVYLHGLVRDRNGKKMSKSNPETCIDPLDMISEFGADALRLSLFVGSSAGNDMRLYKEKIEGYRNFVNKLWNVARYILTSVDENSFTPDPLKGEKIPEPLTLADKWILSRFQDVIEGTTKMIDEYKFSQAAEDLYAFTWSDLADWYLEISKVQKQGNEVIDSEGAQTRGEMKKNTDQILAYLLKNLLKLWHPFTPFVTEELWKNTQSDAEEGVPPAKGVRGSGKAASSSLITESWPEKEKKLQDKTVEKDFELLRNIISTIRNLRAEYQVEPAKKISATIVSKKYQKGLDENADVIKFLARVDSLTVLGKGKAPENAVSAVLEDMEIHLPLQGLVDAEKEKSRLQKEITRLEGYLAMLDGKLNNEKFINNAKPDIVESERDKQKKSQEELDKYREQMKMLK